MISSKYGVAQVTTLSSRDLLRVNELFRVITSDRDIILFLIFKIEYGSGFAGCDFT
jgi:hypothetical protein